VLAWRHDLLAAAQLAEHLLGQRDPPRLDAVLDLAQQLDDRERLAKAYHARMRHAIDTGQNDAALALVEPYAAIVAQGVSDETAMGFHQRVGFLYYRVANMDRALFHHDQALRLADAARDPHWQAYVLNTRGTVLMCLGRFQDSLDDFTRAAGLWDVPARRIFRTFALDNRADVYYYLGHYETVVASKAEALIQYREFRYPIAEAECLAEMGNALRALGRTAEAEQFLLQGLALSESLGDSYDLVQSLLGLAALYGGGTSKTAWKHADAYACRAVVEAERAHLPHGVIQGLAQRALVRVRLGDPAEALKFSERAVDLLAELRIMEGPEEEVYWIHSRVLTANHQSRSARAALARAAAEMSSKAERLRDSDLRRTFLERVPLNRAIRAALKK
jgi:tetratricopeptide (TPR) repeat protein